MPIDAPHNGGSPLAWWASDPAGLASVQASFYQHQQQPQQQQQLVVMVPQTPEMTYLRLSAEQLYHHHQQDEEDELLAAIDVRLQELLRMRKLCHAAAALQEQADAISSTLTPTPATAAPAAKPSAQAGAQDATQTATALNAARIAAAKLRQVQELQRMQLGVQRELLHLLAAQQ